LSANEIGIGVSSSLLVDLATVPRRRRPRQSTEPRC
jgi:hypothetical protein